MNEITLLNKVFDELWPLFRSITGPGIEKSLDIFSSHMSLKIDKIPSGTKVFDWTVPDEWHASYGRLWGPDDELICDTEINNLHIVNYSEPVSGTFTLEELQPHLHSLEHLPDAIPYVTSYYNRTWGFCITENVRKKLKPGNYRVKIKTKFIKEGGVPYGTTIINGESQKEILLTSYLCHPSLANNELSGPLVLLALYNRIKLWPRRRYSYRFLLNPETIGSLCFLSKNHQYLKKNLISGLILTCLGGPSESLHYKKSKHGQGLIDNTLQNSFNTNKNWIIESFTPLGGSDERQYCAPGFNLPVGRIVRTMCSQKEYHNSLDNKEFMDINQIIKSVEQIESMLKIAEISGNPVNLFPYGEPQLGKRGLYPNINSYTKSRLNDDVKSRNQINSILTVLSMSDGYTDMHEIAEKCWMSVEEIKPIIELMENESLIKFNGEPIQ